MSTRNSRPVFAPGSGTRHVAVHVQELGDEPRTDADHRWPYLEEQRAVLVSKDEDFVTLQLPDRFAFLWLRCGNISNRGPGMARAGIGCPWSGGWKRAPASSRCDRRSRRGPWRRRPPSPRECGMGGGSSKVGVWGDGWRVKRAARTRRTSPDRRHRARRDAPPDRRRSDRSGFRAGQREQRRAAQIAEVEEGEAAEAQVDAGRSRILRRLLRRRRRRAAGRVAAPAPASGVRSVSPAALTTTASTPASGILSPGFGVRCLPFARTCA